MANNYVANIPTSISSDQADLRLDQIINSKMSVFGRGTYKIRSVDVVPSGTPVIIVKAENPRVRTAAAPAATPTQIAQTQY